MQGTSLDEVFGNFTANADFQTATFTTPLYGIRATPQIPLRDISGSTLYQITQETLLNSLSEQPPMLQKNAAELRSTIDEFRNLKSYHNYLLNEIMNYEKNIKDLETVQQKNFIVTEEYTAEVLRMGILSKEEFTTLQEKTKELQEIRKSAATKCLESYKKQIIGFETKFREVNTNLNAYREFVKEGVKEMLGSEAKPNMCSICLEKEVDQCLVPCGHTFCGDCVKKSTGGLNADAILQTRNCMTCRTPISKQIKIFL